MMPKTCWIFAALLLATPSWGQGSTAQQCSSIADPAARLACYDAAQPPARSLPANPPAGASRYPEFNSSPRVQANPPPTASAPAAAAATRGKLVAGVASYSLSSSGRFTIVLDNGQVWKQVDSDDGIAQFRKEGRNMVAISKGFLWSYDLKLNAASAVYKVTRVK